MIALHFDRQYHEHNDFWGQYINLHFFIRFNSFLHTVVSLSQLKRTLRFAIRSESLQKFIHNLEFDY